MKNQSRIVQPLISCLRPVTGGATLLAALALVLPTGAVAAAPPTVTETFESTGAEQSFTVPAGVSSVRVQAIGASGQSGSTSDDPFESFSPGGDGADVTGELPVTPGETLYVEVAGDGFGGGGTPGVGGGTGGGASDVRTVSSAAAEGSLESRLLVAGGGGGGGGAFDGGSGGRGGDAGVAGAVGSGEFIEGGSSGGGGAGTLTGGGVGGALCQAPNSWSGQNGALGLGGVGGTGVEVNTGGGGGGAGYWGGGGGEGACEYNPFSAGGGGGGSSYVAEDVTSATFGLVSTSTEPVVKISYTTPATATPEASTITFPGVQPQGTVSASQTITLTNSSGTPLQLSAETFADSSPQLTSDHPEDFLIGSSSCIGAIPFEGSCQLSVRFAPQGRGTRTATLQIAGNMGAGPTTIALEGTGGALPQGQAGVAGATQTGPQGPAGPRGERGPQGPVGVYECHPRQENGRFKIACFVRVASVSSVPTTATLRRDGKVYASGPVAGAKGGKGLLMHATRHVPAGRYTLVLVSHGAATSRTVTIR